MLSGYFIKGTALYDAERDTIVLRKEGTISSVVIPAICGGNGCFVKGSDLARLADGKRKRSDCVDRADCTEDTSRIGFKFSKASNTSLLQNEMAVLKLLQTKPGFQAHVTELLDRATSPETPWIALRLEGVRFDDVFHTDLVSFINAMRAKSRVAANIIIQSHIARRCCDTVEWLHQQGLLHNDVAVDNYFVRPDRDARLVDVVLGDFGHSRETRAKQAGTAKPTYAAPPFLWYREGTHFVPDAWATLLVIIAVMMHKDTHEFLRHIMGPVFNTSLRMIMWDRAMVERMLKTAENEFEQAKGVGKYPIRILRDATLTDEAGSV